MHDNETIKRQYFELARKYENTAKMVAGRYHPHGGYPYKSLLCDLITHLWEIYPRLPQNLSDHDEQAWIYTVLSNKARNLVRNEQLHLSKIEYCDTLPDVAEEDEDSNLTKRLYRLIDELDPDDQRILDMYFEGKTMEEIGQTLGGSDQRAIRRLNKIRKKLRELNTKIG
jgi:RNA polymerase sigma factor (sigma-70 family)